MGVVWEAERENLGGRVALKILRPEFAQQPQFAARFFNEAHATNAIDHPAMVKIFDHGETPEGAAFLAMEYVAGESLAHRLERQPRMTPATVMRLGRQIASAIAAAHEKQIIHRDLKPENIMIVPDDDSMAGERIKILDFGIAKIANQARQIVHTQGNVVMGTPPYMSPEQCAGGKGIDDKSDVYALGIILYQMLAGKTPFVADEPGMYIGMHLFKEPPPLPAAAPEADPALVELVQSMLAKDPGLRPAMAQVAFALHRLTHAPPGLTRLGEGQQDFTGIVLTSGDMPFVEPPMTGDSAGPASQAQPSETRATVRSSTRLPVWPGRGTILGRRIPPGARVVAVSLALAGLIVLVAVWGLAPSQPTGSEPEEGAGQRLLVGPQTAPTASPASLTSKPAPPPGPVADTAGNEADAPVEDEGDNKSSDERTRSKTKGAGKRTTWTQEETDKLLILARGKSAAGNPTAAMNDAYQAALRGNATNAWAMAGVYACTARNLRTANEALRFLNGKSGDRFWYTYVVSQCQKVGYQHTADRGLRLPSP
jgi:serine/threonine-protein kinase